MSDILKLGDILPDVLRDIERRCELNPNNLDFKPDRAEHRARVFSATADFLRSKRPRANRQRQIAGQKVFFENRRI